MNFISSREFVYCAFKLIKICKNLIIKFNYLSYYTIIVELCICSYINLFAYLLLDFIINNQFSFFITISIILAFTNLNFAFITNAIT